MSAKVSTASQRAVADRKVVFRSVLDNPYKVSWPYVPVNVQNVILASLVTLLSELGNYYVKKRQINRKRKREEFCKRRQEKASAGKRLKTGQEKRIEADDDETGETGASPDPPEAPSIAPHLTVGINSVTKRLEAQARSLRMRASLSEPEEPPPSMSSVAPLPITHVFVCRADVDPPVLVSHLPELVAACNASPTPLRTLCPVYLIPLPKRAEGTLAAILGLPRVSIVALDNKTPGLETLTCHLSQVQPPCAPWLTSAAGGLGVTHEPSQIKQIRTTAPKDMRMAKKERTESRRAAKERRKAKQSVDDDKSTVARSSRSRLKQKRKIKIFAQDSSMPEVVGLL